MPVLEKILINSTTEISTKIGRCRLYWTGSRWQPSITSIVRIVSKPHLIQWAADTAVQYLMKHGRKTDDGWLISEQMMSEASEEHKQQAMSAADSGSRVHQACTLWMDGFHNQKASEQLDEMLITMDVKEAEMLDAFIKWAEEVHLVPVFTEKIVHGNGFSGRLDAVVSLNGTPTLIDIKTVRSQGGYYPEWALQLAGYKMAYQTACTEGPQIQKVGIVKLSRDIAKCHFSEDPRGPKFTDHLEQYENAFFHLAAFFANFCKRELEAVL